MNTFAPFVPTLLKPWIVRVVRSGNGCADYVGTYRSATAVGALTIAGRDPYLRTLPTKRVVAIEAVEAGE